MLASFAKETFEALAKADEAENRALAAVFALNICTHVVEAVWPVETELTVAGIISWSVEKSL